MKFIKRHLFMFICVAVAVLGLALAGLGMTSGGDVVQQLREGQDLANQIDRYLGANKPATVADIEQMVGVIGDLERARGEFLEEASRVNRREPLVKDFFPKAGDPAARYAFQDAYKAQFDRFLADLHARTSPDREELSSWRHMIEAEQRAHKYGETPLGFNNVDPLVLAELPDEVRWKYGARASIWAARHARCFAELESFDVETSVYQASETGRPDMDLFWSAQAGLWIQQDIVGALIDLNSARADEVTAGLEEGQEAWVGQMPIKQIVGIRVTDYVYDEEDPPEVDTSRLQGIYSRRGFQVSADVGSPPEDVAAVITDRGGSEEFEVQHVRVVLVVDPRYLPTIIDAILKRNLYSLLNVRYRYVPMSQNHVGLLYGSDPVIQVEIDLAVHWLNDIYMNMMPDETKERLGYD